MSYQLHAIHVGRPKKIRSEKGEIYSGFIKKPVNQSLWLSSMGLEGDGQADLKNHGGEDKALLMYSFEHYPYWEKRYGRSFEVPSFGENVTVKGLTEADIHIGDVFQLGKAVIQVSQPRNPCYKIAAVHGIKDMPAVVTETGYSGFYFRVLQEGYISPQDELERLKKDINQVSISDVYKVIYQNPTVGGMNRIMQVDAAAVTLKESLQRKVTRLEANQ